MPMTHPRRLVLTLCSALLAGAVLPAAAQTDYPNRPIKVIVPYPPGGVSDGSTRAIMERLSAQLGQPIVIDNKAGAASTVASNYVASQSPDGYTLYAAPVSLVVNPILQNAVQYDPRKDFEPISMLMRSPFALHVNPSLGVKDMKELLALVRANPDKYAMGTSGLGSINHLAAEYFIRSFDLKMAVAHYRGGAPAAQDLMGGTIQMMFSAVNEAAPLVRAGRTVGIAVTSAERVSLLPELPTVEEAAGLKGFEAVFWMALIAPANTPKPIVDKLQAAVQAVNSNTDLRDSLASKGVELKLTTPDVVRQTMDRDEAKWGKLIRDLGLKEGS